MSASSLASLVTDAQETCAIAAIALTDARLTWHAVLMAEGDDRGRAWVANAKASHTRATEALALAEASLAKARADEEKERERTALAVAEQIKEVLAQGTATASEILSLPKGRRRVAYETLQNLTVSGEVVRGGAGTSARYWLSEATANP